MTKARWAVLAGVCVTGTLVAAAVVVLRSDYILERITIDSQRSLVIRARSEFDLGVPYYGDFFQNGRIVETTFLGSWGGVYVGSPPPAPQFQVIVGEKGRLVGIVEHTRPDVLLAAYDYDVDEGWPSSGYHGVKTSSQRGRDYASRLSVGLERSLVSWESAAPSMLRGSK